MQVIVNLQDNNGVSQDIVALNLNTDATVDQLRVEIQKIFSIDPIHQRLSVGGTDLYWGTLASAGVKDRERIVLKHGLFKHWIMFYNRYQRAQKMKHEHRTKVVINEAAEHLKKLKAADFFFSFSSLDSTALDFADEFADHLDYSNKYMEYAAQDYFSKLLDDTPENPQVQIKCSPKEHSGAQGGLVCEVHKNSVLLGKFHVKAHLGVASRSVNHDKPDMRELFVYRLLEIIHVGPEVHFLPSTHNSAFELYIATKDVMEFKRAIDVSTMSHQCTIELDLLRLILHLTDLHLANYGLDGEGNLSIVDFQITSHNKSLNTQEFLRGNEEERLQIGKISFARWNLPEAIEEADRRLIYQKLLFSQKKITFQPSTDYADYYGKIKDNVVNFAKLFDSA